MVKLIETSHEEREMNEKVNGLVVLAKQFSPSAEIFGKTFSGFSVIDQVGEYGEIGVRVMVIPDCTSKGDDIMIVKDKFSAEYAIKLAKRYENNFGSEWTVKRDY